jgi:hypothetical protein
MTTEQPAADTIAANSSASEGGDIVARAGRYYRNTRYLMFIMLVGMGGWFLYDGFVKYPRENELVKELQRRQLEAERVNDQATLDEVRPKLKEHTFHTDTSLLTQRLLGFALPPLGVALLIWALYNSRGEYRMSGTKLSVPGHPTIDLAEIKTVNNSLWDRKGIAYVAYETAQGQSGEIRLDDFIYDRPPTDRIYERIADHMGIAREDEDEGEDESEDAGSESDAGAENGSADRPS